MDIAALVNAASLCDGRRIGVSSASVIAATASQLEASSAPISACDSLPSNATLTSSGAVAVAASHASTSITAAATAAVPPAPAAAPGPEPAPALDHLGSSPMGLKRRSTISAGSGNGSPFPKVFRASHELPSHVALHLPIQGAATFLPACLLQSPTSATGGSELSASVSPAIAPQKPVLQVTCPGNPVIGAAAGPGIGCASATSTSHISPNATNNALHGATSTFPTAAGNSFGGTSSHQNAFGLGAGAPVKREVSLERPANHHSGSGSGANGADAGANASALGPLLSHTSPPHAVAFEATPTASAHQWAHLSQQPPSMHSSSTVAPSLAHGSSAVNAVSPPAVAAVGTPAPPLGSGPGSGAHHQHGHHQQTQQTGLLVPAGCEPPTGSTWLPLYARESSKCAESMLLEEKLHFIVTRGQYYVLPIAQARGAPEAAEPFGDGEGGGDEINGGSAGGFQRHRSRSQRSISLGPVHQPRIGLLADDELDEVLLPRMSRYQA